MWRHRARAHKAQLIEAGRPTLVLPPLQAAEQSSGRRPRGSGFRWSGRTRGTLGKDSSSRWQEAAPISFLTTLIARSPGWFQGLATSSRAASRLVYGIFSGTL